MSLKDEFKKMVRELATKFTLPPIANIFFPPFYKGGQPKDAQFMAISLEDGAAGVSFVLLPDEKMGEYNALQSSDFVKKNPLRFALEFGDNDPLKEMISLAAINAICPISPLIIRPIHWGFCRSLQETGSAWSDCSPD